MDRNDTERMPSVSVKRYAVDGVVVSEVAVPERGVGSDDEPHRELEPGAACDGRRQAQLERERIGETAVVVRRGGGVRRYVGGLDVVVGGPVVQRVAHRYLQPQLGQLLLTSRPIHRLTVHLVLFHIYAS